MSPSTSTSCVPWWRPEFWWASNWSAFGYHFLVETRVTTGIWTNDCPRKRGLGCFHLFFVSFQWFCRDFNKIMTCLVLQDTDQLITPSLERSHFWDGRVSGCHGSQGMINTAKTWEDDSQEKIHCFKTLRALFCGERFVHQEKWLEMLQKLFRTWVSSDSDWWKLMESTKMGTKKWATVDGCKNLRFPIRAWDEYSKCLPTAW